MQCEEAAKDTVCLERKKEKEIYTKKTKKETPARAYSFGILLYSGLILNLQN